MPNDLDVVFYTRGLAWVLKKSIFAPKHNLNIILVGSQQFIFAGPSVPRVFTRKRAFLNFLNLTNH